MKKIENLETYLVGGAVRDKLLGLDSKDRDYVVVNSNIEEMESLGFSLVGKDFPVFLHPETGEEYALARKERKIGNGYSGFSCDTNNVLLKDDLFRRDLTINAIAFDEKNNEYIDPFNGKKDLENKILKHVSNHFKEDPVRVLRIARFAARYDFNIHKDTLIMMKEMVKNGETNYLTQERVQLEFEKVINEKYLLSFFNILNEIKLLENLGNFNNIFKYSDVLNKQDESIKKNIIFQNFTKKEMYNFKLISDDISRIFTFNEWKNKSEYHQMNAIDKYNFIKIFNIMKIKNFEEKSTFLDNLNNFIKTYELYQSKEYSYSVNIEKILETIKQDAFVLKEIQENIIINSNPKNIGINMKNGFMEYLEKTCAKNKVFKF